MPNGLKILIIVIFIILFFFLVWRNLELSSGLNKFELNHYEKYRKWIKIYGIATLVIFICLTVAGMIMEYVYDIDYFVCSSPIGFAGIVLTILCTIMLIYKYIILHKITKKW